MGAFRCQSCGYSEPIPKTKAKIWPKVCPNCAGTNIEEIIDEKVGILRRLFGGKKDRRGWVTDSAPERMHSTEYQGDAVGVLFDWEAIGGEGTKAWQVFCESCDPTNLVENTVLMTDVSSEACKIEIKALANRSHALQLFSHLQ